VSIARVGLLIVAAAAAIVAVYALFQAFHARTAPPIVIEDAAGLRPVVVDVRGAVNEPGVYELPPGARVQDAILAAGGLSPRADLSTVNLARRLRDEEVVTILALPEAGGTPAGSAVEEPAAQSRARININTATIAELDVLPGIGDVTAERIVRFREENGPYRSVDDLIHVEGISDRTIDEFREMVTVGP
jgi:competence protein ComEA